jgi:hypothetical protein
MGYDTPKCVAMHWLEALNCCPWFRPLTHWPETVTHSPALISVA